MDTIHDLGGKQGFGPVDVNEPEAPWHYDWEGRMWAMAQSSRNTSVTIDWWRHVVEQLPPHAYMTIPYFEKWCMTDLALGVDCGTFTMEDALNIVGKNALRAEGASRPEVLNKEQILEKNRTSVKTFEEEVDFAPAFAVGDPVKTLSHSVPTHTRLPAYARGRSGKILAQRGAHPLPDKSAQGQEVPEHLYTVVFTAQELWGKDADPRDTVTLDLWESYLEQL
ncbi:nitrile hydratase subunit beta [Halocynthiibacter styelae]|uniref:Nitrile hydratase subunit beta n=1 Tax=Halocynthiibacter styelae TaxID=2761955 RepID=A0A8J7LKH7_9RHOB|nr:nitrile hydratase subunit beta [Paenihalocynthiibacter styelae]MBI1492714.1 nitrile hydratase subunit beta [Paenihalocynthiibacter styelae]